jgi:hypothetical protein
LECPSRISLHKQLTIWSPCPTLLGFDEVPIRAPRTWRLSY